MPDVMVMRYEGNLRGDDIVDPLLTTVETCLARGRNELDDQASGLQDVQVQVDWREDLRPGQVAGVADILTGLVWYGKITSVAYRYFQDRVEVELRLKRPTVVPV